MIATFPTGRAGRFLALGVTLLAAALLWAAAGAPLIAWYADRADTLAARAALARRMAALAATLPQLQNDAAGTRGTQPELLEGTSDAVAAASLQQLVQDMAARSGARLASVEVLPVQGRGPYREIGVRVALNAPWPVLVRLLAAVTEARPRMLVDDLQLRAAPAVAAATTPGRPAPDAPLDASLGIFAFRLGTPTR